MCQTSSALFKIAGLKNLKLFCRDLPLSFFHRFLNTKFSNRFNFTWNFFWKNHIIHYPAFPCISTEEIMAAKISKLQIYSLFQTAKYLWGNNQLLLCRPSYLTICVWSPNHFDLNVQLHELAIFIRCTVWLRIIHFSRC